MRYGTITCECKQVFYFETVAETIKCPKCQMIHNIESYPEKVEEEILEVEGDI